MLETLLGYAVYAAVSVGIGAGLAWLKGRKKSKALTLIVGAIEAAPPEVGQAAKGLVYQAAKKAGINESIVDPVVQGIVDAIEDEPGGLENYTTSKR